MANNIEDYLGKIKIYTDKTVIPRQDNIKWSIIYDKNWLHNDPKLQSPSKINQIQPGQIVYFMGLFGETLRGIITKQDNMTTVISGGSEFFIDTEDGYYHVTSGFNRDALNKINFT